MRECERQKKYKEVKDLGGERRVGGERDGGREI